MNYEAGLGIPAGEDNPNLADEPTSTTELSSQARTSAETLGNIWWSDWANTEQQLQMMRPEGLPMPIEPGEGSFRREAAEGASAGMGLEFRSTSDGRSTSGCGDSDFHAAAVELDRQTSVGHYIPERAMGFLRESEELVREPQYYNIHSGGTTPDGERDSVPGSDNAGRRPREVDENATLLGQAGYAPQARGRNQGLDSRVQALDWRVGQSRQAASIAGESMSQPLQLEEHIRSIPTRDLFGPLEATGCRDPVLLALVHRLEEAEARTRSSASFHSTTDLGMQSDGLVGSMRDLSLRGGERQNMARRDGFPQRVSHQLPEPQPSASPGPMDSDIRSSWTFAPPPQQPSFQPSYWQQDVQLQQASGFASPQLLQQSVRGPQTSGFASPQLLQQSVSVPQASGLASSQLLQQSASVPHIFGIEPSQGLQHSLGGHCPAQAQVPNVDRPIPERFDSPPTLPAGVESGFNDHNTESAWQRFMRHVEGLYSSSGFVSSRVPLLPGMDSSGCTANRGNQRVQVPSTGVHNLASTRDENSLSHQRGYEGQLLVRPPEATLDLMNLEAPVTTPNVAPKMQSQVHATGSVLKMPVMHSQAHPTGPVLKMPVMQPPTHAIHATVTVPAVPNMQTQHAISPDPLALTTIDHAVSGSQVATNAGLVGNSSSSVPKQLSQSAATLESMPLIDLLSPIAESPFRPCAVPHEGQSTPRTPTLGTSMGTSYTPGGTRVPEGPPPVTPPPCPPPSVEPEASRSVSFGPVTYTPLPAPPKPPGDAYDSTQLGAGTSGHSRSEEPSRLVMQLPVLSISDVAEASVVTGDWLARLGPVMRSLSPGAPGWWNRTIEVATSFYQRWLLADPIQRLAIKTEAVSYVWDHGPLARVEERGSILLLQALPQDLQTEAVSTRALSSSALVFLTMSRFQPGGTAEKSTILAYLTQPSVEGPQGIVSNHAALRKWERLFRRCRELGLQAPDPSLLIRALDGLGKIINNKSHQAGFRLSSFRHEQQLDVCPTEAKALHYCQLLTAELETLLLAYQDSGKQQRLSVLQGPSAKEGRETPSPKTPNPKAPSHKPAGKASPHVKPGSLTPKHVPTSAATQSGPLDDKGICKFFSSPGGCRYGRSCVHPHSTLSPQDDRCFNCGAVGHTMTACERPTKPRPSQAVAAAEPLHKSGVPKGNQKGRRPKGRKLEASQASGESAADKGEEDGEFENFLKTIACEEPHVLASLKEIGPGGGRGLIDGGATHCLRYGAPGEFRLAKPVSVKLASGTSNELRMSAVGTLLSQDSQIQPIIPMGLCAEVLGLQDPLAAKGMQSAASHHG